MIRKFRVVRNKASALDSRRASREAITKLRQSSSLERSLERAADSRGFLPYQNMNILDESVQQRAGAVANSPTSTNNLALY